MEKQLASGIQWNKDVRNKIRSFILTSQHPVTNKDICEYLQIPYSRNHDRIIRKHISILVTKENEIITSGDEGYFMARTVEDLQKEKKRLQKPSFKLFKRAKTFQENFYRHYPELSPTASQLTLEGFFEEL